MADDDTKDAPNAGGDENQPGWAAPGETPREPAAPAAPAPGEQTLPPPPPSATPSAAWQAAPTVPSPSQGAPPAGVPRRGGRAWLFVLIALLSVTVIAVIVGSVLFVDRSQPAYQAAHDFISDFYDGRTNAATARLCAEDRERSERALTSIKVTLGSTTSKPFVNPFSVDRTDNGATVEYTVDGHGSQKSYRYELPMREENGRWLACPLSGQG